MAGEIVLGFDGSAGSRAALDQTITLARDLGTSVVVAFGYATSPLGGENKDEELTVLDLARAVATEAEGKIRAAGIEVSVEIVHQRPFEGIMAVATARHARLIVVGAHGESPLTGAIIGSVTYKLVHRSTVPVLVVPPVG